MKKRVQNWIKRKLKKIVAPVPARLSQKFLKIDDSGLKVIEDSLRRNYHTGWRQESNYSEENYREDLQAHLTGRLDRDRRFVIPWLDNARELAGKNILEIGCGTGSSSIALAEQGAKVTGIDIDEGALVVATERAAVYGVNAEFILTNAQDISSHFKGTKFDIVIFFACLEHMTIPERLSALKSAWELLPVGGLLVIVETPNRLWHFDNHTSMLPFYHWLPDELAFAFARYSPRENFHELYREDTEITRENFLRRGRGVSFHELQVAFDGLNKLKVIGNLAAFHRYWYWLNETSLDRRYKLLLRCLYPNIHNGFFEKYLDLIIEKS
jgi:S-adenosylmethionine-dependent methyltransferase